MILNKLSLKVQKLAHLSVLAASISLFAIVMSDESHGYQANKDIAETTSSNIVVDTDWRGSSA